MQGSLYTYTHIKKCLVNGYILLGSSRPLSTILSPPKVGTLNKHFKHKKLVKPQSHKT